MPGFISCDNNGLTDEQLMAAMITKDDEGNFALRTMIVDACENDAIDCDNKDQNLSAMALLRKCVGISDCGKPAIRLASPELYNLLNP